MHTHFLHSFSTDAIEKIKSMLQAKESPSSMAITRLVQTLGNQGNIAGIKEVESLINNLGESINVSSLVFVNNKALAHIKK